MNTAALAGAKSISISYLSKNLYELTQTAQAKKAESPKQSGREIAAGIIGRLVKKE